MENIRNFFNEVICHTANENNNYKHKNFDFDFVKNFDFERILYYKDRIFKRLVLMDNLTRKAYANLIIEEIGMYDGIYYFYSKIRDITVKGVRRKDETEVVRYYLYDSFIKDVCSNNVIDDIEFFFELICNLFSKFNINLNEIAKEKNVLLFRAGKETNAKSISFLMHYHRDKCLPNMVQDKILNKLEKVGILNKLESAGLIEKEPLKWLKTKSLLAYFVDVANDKLDIKHGKNRVIMPFEIMFNETGLKSLMSEYKNKTCQYPVDYKIIDGIFKDIEHHHLSCCSGE